MSQKPNKIIYEGREIINHNSPDDSPDKSPLIFFKNKEPIRRVKNEPKAK